MSILSPEALMPHVASQTASAAQVNFNEQTLYQKIEEIVNYLNNTEGSKSSLTARLNVLLNQDGTPKSGITWTDANLSYTYLAANQFSVSGIHTNIFVINRRLTMTTGSGTVQSYITAVSVSGGNTTVTINDSVLTDPVSKVEYETYSITAGGEWINPDLSPAYSSATEFTVEGDQTDIYLPYRRLRIDDSEYSEVVDAVFDGNSPGTTTVEIANAVLTDPVTSIEHGAMTPLSNKKRSISIDTIIPIGSIVAWMPGYFTTSENGGFTLALGSSNDAEGANAYLNPLGWYVCDGALFNDPDSPIFNDTGRCLPKLTDDRFLMGDSGGGISAGGSNTMTHTHDVTTSDHTHGHDHHHAHQHYHFTNVNITGWGVSGAGAVGALAICQTDAYGYTSTYIGTTGYRTFGSGGARNSSNTADQQWTGSPYTTDHATTKTSTDLDGGETVVSGGVNTTGGSSDENRPLYLSCFYIMRVK